MSKQVLELALEALMVSEYCIEKERYSTDCSYGSNFIQSRVDRIEQTEKLHKEAIDALKEALETMPLKQQGEPVGRVTDDFGKVELSLQLPVGTLLYTSAPTMLSGQAPCDIPESWQLVPKELTPEMADAYWKEYEKERPASWAAYRAMLYAAPKP
jgi:hypothetical protein